jgi:ferrous iron transport protein B
MLKAVLIGNPNAGKSTLFNRLTGAKQRVANYPGTTVERKEGSFQLNSEEVIVIDLPGLYDLTPSSPDQALTSTALFQEKPDVVIQALDASNLARSLYLTLELTTLGLPLVLCLNMIDLAKLKGIDVRLHELSSCLGVPVIETIALKGVGIDELKLATLKAAKERHTPKPMLDYGEPIDLALRKLQAFLEASLGKNLGYSSAYLALKLLEWDESLSSFVLQNHAASRVFEEALRDFRERLGHNPETLLKQKRYEKALEIAKSLTSPTMGKLSESWGNRLDRWLLKPKIGIPAFIFLLFGVFSMTFFLGNPLTGGIERLIATLSTWILSSLGGYPWLASFLADGVLAGVGTVLTFLPQIAILFLTLVALEDSGAMARAAYLLEGWMSKLGLTGKSVIPMVLGFGCAVPALMATRIIESRKERLITILILPLVSCSARLPIYVLITTAFFPISLQPFALLGVYTLGILLAFVFALILTRALKPGEESPFLLEIPPYRLPSGRTLLFFTWQRISQFLKRAGTIIFAFSVLMWALSRFPSPSKEELAKIPPKDRPAYSLRYSFTGRIADTIEPILKPIGFDGRIGMALIGATLAREIFISQLGIAYAIDAPEGVDYSLKEYLRRDYGPLVGLCLLLYFLIASPCMSASSVMAKESGTIKLALLHLGFLFGLGYTVVFLTYRIGFMLGSAF